MVDSISGKSNSIQDSGLLNVDRQQAVEKTATDATQAANGGNVSQLLDQATISDAAKSAYENEKEVLRFSRLAQRAKEPYNADKVGQIKNMVDNGRISEYLRGINTDELANSLLNSPSGAFLNRKAT